MKPTKYWTIVNIYIYKKKLTLFFCFQVKSLEEGKLDTLNEEEFLKAQENQENQGSGLGEENKDLLGLDSSGGLMKYGSRLIYLLKIYFIYF